MTITTGLVGDIRENEFYLYTHYEILVKYNDNRVSIFNK